MKLTLGSFLILVKSVETVTLVHSPAVLVLF